MAFCVVAESEEAEVRVFDSPIVEIDASKAEKAKRGMVLQKLYYKPAGYYQTVEKMQEACNKTGYDFPLV